MIRDYVHHTPAPRYRQSPQTRAKPLPLFGGAWLVLLSATFGATFLFGFHFKTEHHPKKQTYESSAELETAQPSSQRSPEVERKPRFDFYDVLTGKATEAIQEKGQRYASMQSDKALHVVELGYFSDPAALQVMMERLRMAGFDPQITKSVSQQRSGRIFFGPYPNEDGALSLKHALQEAGFRQTLVVEYAPS